MVKPRNPEKNPAATRANFRIGYGANNPEPGQFKLPVKKTGGEKPH